MSDAQHHGLQVQHPVRDIDGDHTVRIPEVLQVQTERLAGQQVSRDGVGAEGIENQHVELLRAHPEFLLEDIRASPGTTSMFAWESARYVK